MLGSIANEETVIQQQCYTMPQPLSIRKVLLKFPKKCFVKILKFIDTRRHNTFPSFIIKMRLFSHIFKLKCINCCNEKI